MRRGCVVMEGKNQGRKARTAPRKPASRPQPDRSRDDGRPELDPKKPPTTGRAPDLEKGRPKDTGRYGA